MADGEPQRKEEIRKEDFISKFQINEIIPLLKMSEKYNVDIGEGKKLLVKALHTARTTRNMDEIAQFLEGSKKEIERSLQNHFIRWHSSLKMDLERKKEAMPSGSTVPHLMETAKLFIIDKNYETAATLLSRCEVELFKVNAMMQPAASHSQTPPPQASILQSRMSAPGPEASLPPPPTPAPVTPAQPPPEQPSHEQHPEPHPSEHPPSIQAQNIQASPAQAPISEKAPAVRRTEVKDTRKCGICMGKIKPGVMALECACGNFYHEQCSKRAGKCPNCGTGLA